MIEWFNNDRIPVEITFPQRIRLFALFSKAVDHVDALTLHQNHAGK